VVSICAPAETAPIARVATNAERLDFEKNMDVPKVGQQCFRVRYLVISGKYVANRRQEIGLEIEPFAASGTRRRFFRGFMVPFCGKKICIVRNGFLLSEALGCAEVLS
jgi:hypothetical protein